MYHKETETFLLNKQVTKGANSTLTQTFSCDYMTSVGRLTDLLDLTIVVDWDVKRHSNKQTMLEKTNIITKP